MPRICIAVTRSIGHGVASIDWTKEVEPSDGLWITECGRQGGAYTDAPTALYTTSHAKTTCSSVGYGYALKAPHYP